MRQNLVTLRAGLRCWAVGVIALVGSLRASLNAADAPDLFAAQIRPLLKQYCFSCHSAEKHKGSLNLERFESMAHLRRDLKAWQGMAEMLEAGEMPPEKKPQPSAEQRRALIAWTRGFLNAEAIARAGDPGFVPLRRLSNAEYNYTLRDLLGVDLAPAREFPADGAAGEGFTNAAEALSDMSPTLLNKYLAAAKEISAHAVLLPDGFRFSLTKTRRDWTNEAVASLRRFYADYTSDGKLPLLAYVTATLRYREQISNYSMTIEAVAAKEKVNAKYLGILWQTLVGKEPSFPLDLIRAHWRAASEKDAGALVSEITSWQNALFNFVKIGSYRFGDTRQVPNDPKGAESQTLKVAVKPAPGQTEVVVYLAARDLFPRADAGPIVWRRPRMEGAAKAPLLLRDYARFGAAYEVDYAAAFADCPKYLAAVAEAGKNPKWSAEDVARERHLNPEMLARWMDLLALRPAAKESDDLELPARNVPAYPLKLLAEKTPVNPQRPKVLGWRRSGADLPVVVSNASDKEEHIPGTAAPHQVVVHPTPSEYVASVWTSPISGRVRIDARIKHVHAGCGNGIAWWLEHRHNDHAEVLAEGTVGVFGKVQVPRNVRAMEKGDKLILAIDPRDGNHVCDLTEVNLTISQIAAPSREWDLAGDVADNIQAGNPHADKYGNADAWSFAEGPTRPVTKSGESIAAGSVLDKWRAAAISQSSEIEKLALDVKALLCGPRPANEKTPDRILYDSFVSADGAFFRGLDASKFAKMTTNARYGLSADRFGGRSGKSADDASVMDHAGGVIEIHLPAALFRDREFVVDAALDMLDERRVVQFSVSTAPPARDGPWDGSTGIVASRGSVAFGQLLKGYEQFRGSFPVFICFPQILPTDEVVCLKQFHREDEPLRRLFLDEAQTRELDRLWEEHRFISKWPVNENKYLPLFIGFVTQDQPKDVLAYFEAKREPFRIRAEAFEKEVDAAVPIQLEKLIEFASRAYRRPLGENEKQQLRHLFQGLRDRGVGNDEAFRGVLTRILVAPAFLFRIEQAPPGKKPGAVNDFELASRLSYFLWSTMPNEELRNLAQAGKLHDPQILQQQAIRMLKDNRVRALAAEFGTQWIHVRGFDEFKEKNEKLFPTFDESLRAAMYEESILFFQDLFENDRPLTDLLNADYTWLNDRLAAHYGIPGITGSQWRKVDGIKKYGRGGILGLASVQAKQAGASRTSPVLRGNWVVETLLGEKLPRPPPDVPRLPEEEGSTGLTTRQMVEKHVSQASCAVCHQRIDPLGFAFERYDAIGRYRLAESTGLPIDCRATLKDGTQLDGIDGVRQYLLTKKKAVVVRLFCRRLLGYALGRAVALSDQSTLDEMVAELDKADGRLSAAVLTIVRSPQFRSIRGSDYSDEE